VRNKIIQLVSFATYLKTFTDGQNIQILIGIHFCKREVGGRRKGSGREVEVGEDGGGREGRVGEKVEGGGEREGGKNRR
jgi:hypothetical protein